MGSARDKGERSLPAGYGGHGSLSWCVSGAEPPALDQQRGRGLPTRDRVRRGGCQQPPLGCPGLLHPLHVLCDRAGEGSRRGIQLTGRFATTSSSWKYWGTNTWKRQEGKAQLPTPVLCHRGADACAVSLMGTPVLCRWGETCALSLGGTALLCRWRGGHLLYCCGGTVVLSHWGEPVLCRWAGTPVLCLCPPHLFLAAQGRTLPQPDCGLPTVGLKDRTAELRSC